MGARSLRQLLKSAYPTASWAGKVDKMSDSQVIAVLARLRAQNKLR